MVLCYSIGVFFPNNVFNFSFWYETPQNKYTSFDIWWTSFVAELFAFCVVPSLQSKQVTIGCLFFLRAAIQVFYWRKRLQSKCELKKVLLKKSALISNLKSADPVYETLSSEPKLNLD